MEKNHSKKYRLIREYPGSPKLNYILEPIKNNKQEYYINNMFINPENHPEFWEEIVEKDYEILSFRLDWNGAILTKRKNGLFICGHVGLSGLYTEENILSNDPEQVNWKGCIEEYGYSIYSIKRLSDGEIFTVGDMVKNGNHTSNILQIFIKDNELLYSTKFTNCANILNNCDKIKQPLFTTEDGVDIFKNDEVSFVNKIGDVFHTSHLKIKKYQSHLLYFSTKEKAKEYIDFHKIQYSKQDVFNIIHKGFDKKSASTLGKHKILAMFDIGPLPSEKQKLFTIEEIEAKLENHFKTWDSTTLIDKQVLLNFLKQ